MPEYTVGISEGISNVDFAPSVTWSQLLDKISDLNITGPMDLLVIGKLYTSSDKISGFTQHYDESEELFYDLKDKDPDNEEDSLDYCWENMGMESRPDKIVGFVIRTLD